MVVVPGATILEVTSAKELLSTIQGGQNHRHVASTQVRSVPSPHDTVANCATSFHTSCGVLLLDACPHHQMLEGLLQKLC